MNSINRQGSTLTTGVGTLGIFAILIVAAAAAQAQTFNINFPAPTTFYATVDNGCQFCPTTTAVATGDLNGDGKLDVVNLDSDLYLNASLGNGDGTFQLPVSLYVYALGSISSSEAIAVGDFNGDHILDVAVWGAGFPNSNHAVQIFLGNGNGTFTEGKTYAAPNSNNFNAGPQTIVAADVNGDGKLDLISLTYENGVFVFLGNGDGTFKAPVNYATARTSGCCAALAVGDLNADGKADLAIAENDGVTILLNAGSGTFGTATYYASGVAGSSPGDGIAIGDVNGDKKPDVVITNENFGAIIFTNKGAGVFAESGTIDGAFMGSTDNLALADLNNDKKLDIVLEDMFGNVYTYFGNGKGKFTTGPAYSLAVYGSGNNLVAVGDFNGDGALDLLDTSNNTTNSVSLGRGDGSFQTAQLYPFAVEGQYQNIAVADFNGDGIPDVVAQGSTAGTITVVLGGPNGTLGTKTTVTTVCTNTFTYGVAAGDVNGDGKADVVSVYGGASGTCDHMAAVSLGLGTGKFKKAALYPTGAATGAQEMQVYLVDVTGDGKLDIVISNSDGSISVLVNKGNGTFAAPVLITSLDTLTQEDDQLTFADFNGDGKMDIGVAANPARTNDQAVYVLPGNGNGTFGAPITTLTGYYLESVVAGDFNKDGKQDLLVTTTSNGCSLTGAQSAYVYLKGNGDGTFAVGPQNCTFYSAAGAPVAVDLNADGKLDVVIPYGRNQQYNGVAILQGNGNGTFTENQLYYPGYAVVSLGVADFNSDGMPDIAALNVANGGYVSIMLNATQPVSVSPLSMTFKAQAVGTKSKAQTVVVTNDQTSSLAINSVTVGGTDPSDFSAKSACKSSLQAGWDCSITVTFTPAATGARSATLSIKDGVGTQTVQLTGTGK